jgi:hypothetical protein
MEATRLLAAHVFIAIPCLRDEHHHHMRQRSASVNKEFNNVIKI